MYVYICACPLSMSDVETGMIVEGAEFCMESGQTAGCGQGVDTITMPMARVQVYLFAMNMIEQIPSILYSMATLEVL